MKATAQARARVSKMNPVEKAKPTAKARENSQPKAAFDSVAVVREVRRSMAGLPVAERQKLLDEAMAIIEAGAADYTGNRAASLTQLLGLDNEALSRVKFGVVAHELKASVEAFLLPIFTKLGEARLIDTDPQWCAAKVACEATAVLSDGWLKPFV